MKSQLNHRTHLGLLPLVASFGLLAGGVMAEPGEILDTNQQCDPAPLDAGEPELILPARPYKVIVRESAEAWADRMAKSGGDSFYAALYYLPETCEIFTKSIGESQEELWVGFDQTYWPGFNGDARKSLRHACTKHIEDSAGSPNEASAARRRVERWILAREKMFSLAHLDVEEMLTIAYLLPQTTETFDWVFEQRPELERGETDPRIVGETLSAGESEYFMGLLFNRLSELSIGELQVYFSHFYIEFEKLFPSDAQEELTEVELDALEELDAVGVQL